MQITLTKKRVLGDRYALGPARPETFRLPRGGGVDPYFGFTRTFYYNGEISGRWRLIRIKAPGTRRGITLVPYSEVQEFVRKQREAA